MRTWLWTNRGYRDVWLLIVTALVLWATYATYQTAGESHRSLCAYRVDLQHRVDATVKFLAENPDGIPGVPIRTLRDSAANQQRTISTLHSLNCP